jgi:hypothetical protein
MPLIQSQRQKSNIFAGRNCQPDTAIDVDCGYSVFVGHRPTPTIIIQKFKANFKVGRAFG